MRRNKGGERSDELFEFDIVDGFYLVFDKFPRRCRGRRREPFE